MSEREPHLSVDFRHSLGALELDVVFELTRPWTVLFGPSGSGKSTILRAVAGLLRPQQASIALQLAGKRQIVADTKLGIFVPPHLRSVRWSAQRPALFPHMTIRQNLSFAAEANDETKAGADVDRALDQFHLSRQAGARPATLSGGEQQRAALARAAVASEGRLLLLDEPFSGLDVPLRDELVRAMQTWTQQRQTPVLSVTHDVGEAFLLGAEVIRLHSGRATNQGPAAVVLATERSHLFKQLE